METANGKVCRMGNSIETACLRTAAVPCRAQNDLTCGINMGKRCWVDGCISKAGASRCEARLYYGIYLDCWPERQEI